MLWGSGFLLIKFALRGFTPYQIVLVRLALGSVVVTAAVYAVRDSLPRGRLLGLAVAFGVISLVVIVAATRTIYCHGDFAGILHCHFFLAPDHDH